MSPEQFEVATNAAFWSGVLFGIVGMTVTRALGAWFEGRMR